MLSKTPEPSVRVFLFLKQFQEVIPVDKTLAVLDKFQMHLDIRQHIELWKTEVTRADVILVKTSASPIQIAFSTCQFHQLEKKNSSVHLTS